MLYNHCDCDHVLSDSKKYASLKTEYIAWRKDGRKTGNKQSNKKTPAYMSTLHAFFQYKRGITLDALVDDDTSSAEDSDE